MCTVSQIRELPWCFCAVFSLWLTRIVRHRHWTDLRLHPVSLQLLPAQYLYYELILDLQSSWISRALYSLLSFPMIKVCLNQGTNISAVLGLPSWLCLSFASFLFPQTSLPSALAVARACLCSFLFFVLGGSVSLNAGWLQAHSVALASLPTGELQMCAHCRFPFQGITTALSVFSASFLVSDDREGQEYWSGIS